MSLLFLALCVFLATVTHLSASEDSWCYNGCEHTPSHWSEMPSGVLCGGHRQSPIDIVRSHANIDHNLLNFTFTNFNDQHALKALVNNGHTVKCEVVAGQVEVSGGGLNGSYGVLQFHLHWGDTMLHPGSEHLLDGHRYPMEAGGEEPQTPWQNLTSYLNNLTYPDSRIKLFPMKTLLSNVYRVTQDLHSRKVYASPSNSSDFGPQHWSSLPGAFCGGAQQSPVNIVLRDVEEDPKLDQPFSFTNFDDRKAMDYIINTGHTVKCMLKQGMEVSGGGLAHTYSILQFHFHWGDESDHPEGSEHTVDSVKYPMEMHIVTKRNDLTLEAAVNTSDGLAVLAFFMEAVYEKSGGTESEHVCSRSDIHEDMSLDDLLGAVDRSFYYRYNGSLTTPTCNPVVVWTVFREPIRMDKTIALGYQNVYRPTSPWKTDIFTPSSSSPPPHQRLDGTTMLFLLFLLLGPISART
ncbi:hypothetical protein CRUP_010044 [Coryphaenoides rupestris]|nr:hypothetical protein CRUP_010044 [Coryphaenoides rupestris]